ncbi:uncharacterized protein LOC133292904 [Gastrolobium bilobum]|uniref:uncharacterized protein LOC133292904 n=1 Tax=Gastrolobium bilobum TaxID=150636 RepID=UPI002AB0EED3|nr:uncharacterized protein LOC133292904 [Gastrolobium bilobum]
MPSGAKKRKAAKKKKEQETNANPLTNNPQGNDELKSQDEKGSDGVEGGSPAYRDHDHSFNEEMESTDQFSAQSSANVAKSLEELPSDIKIDEAEGGKEGRVVIEADLKSEESGESKDASVVHVVSAKELDYGNGNSSSSNAGTITVKNSKDEPYYSVKETVEFDVTLNNSKDEPNYSVKEPFAFDELIKAIESTLDEMTNENAPVKETGNSVAGNDLLEKSVGSQVGATDLAMKKNEDRVYPFSDENDRKSGLEEPKPKEIDNKVPESVSHSHIPESTNGAEHVNGSDTPECSENEPPVASAPCIEQKTSWWSCCGLFEVLLGSNR